MPNIANPSSVASLSCANSSVLPKAESSVPYLASFIATYTGGNGGSYSDQDVTSTGVTGLTAHLDSGILNNGAGNLVYVITGTATTTGTANFTITIGEKSCSFGIQVVEKGQGGAGCITDYTNCTYKSVTLNSGDQYILPKGSEIISISNPTALTSENDCLDLTKIEEMECWIIAVYGSEEAGCGTPTYGSHNGSKNFFLDGIFVSNKYYSFSGSLEVDSDGNFNPSDLVAKINEISQISPIFVGLNGNWDWDNNCRGGVTTICFKCPSSIAKTIYLPLRTSLVSPSNTGIDTRAYAMPYSEFNGGGKCGCS